MYICISMQVSGVMWVSGTHIVTQVVYCECSVSIAASVIGYGVLIAWMHMWYLRSAPNIFMLSFVRIWNAYSKSCGCWLLDSEYFA